MPSKSTINLLVAAPIAFQASMLLGEITTGGDVEIDIDYKTHKIETTGSSEKTTDGLPFGGDGSFHLMSTDKVGTMFYEGKIGGKATISGNVETEDLYVKIGCDSWDVTAGHFEAADLVGWGQDTLIEKAVNGIFSANEARGRAKGAVMAQYHVGKMATLQLNLLTKPDTTEQTIAATTEGGEATTMEHNVDFTGIRPVAIVTPIPALTITLGAEIITRETQDSSLKWTESHNNFAGNVKYSAAAFDAGASFGSQKVSGKTFEDTDMDEPSQTSMGVYGTFKTGSAGDVGVGYFMNTHKDGKETGEATMTDTAAYLSYTLPVGKKTAIKLAVSQATGKGEVDGSDITTESSMTTARIRLAHTL